MKLRAEMPHFRAMCRDGSRWHLAFDEHQSFEAAWTQGKSFWYGLDAYDARVVVKLADVTGMALWDEARLALWDEEDAELKSRELTDGPKG